MYTDINNCLSLNLCLQRADITSKAVVEVINKTSEYLQPNPATRAKLSMLNTVSKIRGQVNSPGYPQPEGLLGECMTKYGRDMGEDTNFGKNNRPMTSSDCVPTCIFFHNFIFLIVLIMINMPHLCVWTAGGALIDIGESMKRMAEVKDSLDIDVKQNFIDPLQAVAEKDIKDIQVESKRQYASAHTSQSSTNEYCSLSAAIVWKSI